ncbi:MAG: ATP-dependent DNA helicase RecG [Prochloraceae cyanobacterium]
MRNNKPDWIRLQKALYVEADRGYIDLMGNQYRFHDFIAMNFSQKPPQDITSSDRIRWQEMAREFDLYPSLEYNQRKRLVTDARNFLYRLKESLETSKEPPKPKLPRTTSIEAIETVKRGNRPIDLDTLLSQLAEIGLNRSKHLERLNLHTVRDILFYYPREHIDYARQVKIAHLVAGETVTVIGSVKKCNCFTSPKNKKLTIFELHLTDSSGKIKLNRFFAGNRFNNYGWHNKQKRQFPVGSIVAASGLVKQNKYGITLENPEIEVLSSREDNIESIKIGRLLPIYPLTEGITADAIRKAIISALPAAEKIKDPLPEFLRDRYLLVGLKEAIKNIHFPENNDALMHARRRLVFDEFFYLQLGFLQRRQQEQQKQKSAIFSPQGQLIAEFNKLLPFSLTNAQKRVVNEILEDVNSDNSMNRLVQGDVGSGKTVVAVFAILSAIQSGYQAALMAPTEVLAEQHYRKLLNWFSLLHLPVELLTGSTKTAKRREIHSQLTTGELPLLVGTHALIQDPVKFKQLGLVAIDEQHRFGVEQRARLLAKGKDPHVLTMTATPIPRTLALTLHGDLDVSKIDELPPGRQAIETKVVTGRERTKVYDLIRREIAQQRQVYIIFPLIEESEKLDVRAAVEEHQRLQDKIFKDFEIGLLHGRMSSAEKDAALNDFRDNKTQIIVSTTVIEVGVDVPNATVMLIENAERFGLSQLHQLRGRVGRGSHKSYCFLMTNSKTPDARQRLGVLEQYTDGFFIAEMDMRLRGPGEVLGKRQSGLPDFALASLVEDEDILNIARGAAEELICDRSLEHIPSLQQELDRRYQKLLGGGEILT